MYKSLMEVWACQWCIDFDPSLCGLQALLQGGLGGGQTSEISSLGDKFFLWLAALLWPFLLPMAPGKVQFLEGHLSSQ